MLEIWFHWSDGMWFIMFGSRYHYLGEAVEKGLYKREARWSEEGGLETLTE